MIFVPQFDSMDCAPACLCMIANAYGKNYTLQYLRENSYITKDGVSLLGLVQAAEAIGFDTIPCKLTDVEIMNEELSLPCILHWNNNHFVVLRKIKRSLFGNKIFFHISDPAHGLIKLNKEEFLKHWSSDKAGIALFLSPTKKFFNLKSPDKQKIGLKFLFEYLKSFKKQLLIMFSMLLLGSCITLTFPFLTQKLIDKGVNAKNLNLITILLLAQTTLYLGSIFIEVIRNWLVLYIGSKLSISIISDFLKKLLYLPFIFFDSRMIGDFSQRIQDNERIEQFLTSQSLLTFFSMFTFSVFFGVLWFYDYKILLVYLTLTLISIAWSLYWLKKKKILDYFKFQEKSRNQESIYEMINGITEIKLNQFEDYKRQEWESIQQKLFAVNTRILKNDQIQTSGYEFINQIKNIIVTFLAATFVVHGKMTLGELLSVSYIVGQMNAPVNQLIIFFRSLQDSTLSLERLNEVQEHPIEDEKLIEDKNISFQENISELAIQLTNVSFQYEGPMSPYVLEDINLLIPRGKITAIVGASGSGKTTLLKLLLKFYSPTRGDIYFEGKKIEEIPAVNIRKNCGVVMQDGFIFSDSIDRNIATKDLVIDKQKLKVATKIANLENFIENLPLKYKTKIGSSGNGMSGGQKQRILIARSVYKNPHFIFFDEATSALDSENEKIIHDNLQEFFRGKTVIIIAHRLSTVKNADQIIVLKNGKITEQGNHKELVEKNGEYFNLVKNQLELGN